MSRCHCRCAKCDTRCVLPKPPNEYDDVSVKCNKCDKRHPVGYVHGNGCSRCGSTDMRDVSRVPACRSCGGQKFYTSHWMNKRDSSMRTTGCKCAGYPEMTAKGSPHRKGSLYCWYRKDGSQRFPGDPDFRDAEYEQLQKQGAA